ncbi:MAG: cob(I)yrinic acid a,c-diamide adenosyltransferase [Lachnospiraceae bacterium]|nr:cob(I)yrinic acid a,c-diamide adenosyltransferase [Lachnospiraceae bacterium]
MAKGIIRIYSGSGRGKSPAALGRAVQTACRGGRVVVIQFLKNKGLSDSEFLHRLEPEIRVFRFEKSEAAFESLSHEEQEEEIINIRNGLGYARKVLKTGECDLLILDEVLGLVDNGIITGEELKELLALKSDQTDIIMTGNTVSTVLNSMADEVTTITTEG